MAIPGHPRIDARPGVCGGRPTIAGTRIRVLDILEMIAAGVSEAEIVRDFPYVAVEDVRACATFAAEAVSHPIVLAQAAE